MIESVIKPLRPRDRRWTMWPMADRERQLVSAGYPIERWHLPEHGIVVLSAVEVATDRDGSSNGPEYHISISLSVNQRPTRIPSHMAAWCLDDFRMYGGEEDNHVPGGVVRNFWRPVAEPLVGKECPCKLDEPVITENKGDFVWRP